MSAGLITYIGPLGRLAMDRNLLSFDFFEFTVIERKPFLGVQKHLKRKSKR